MTTKAKIIVRGRTQPLAGEVAVPGDKSIGHRAVIFGALASGPVRVTGLSGGEDNRRTVTALEALGVPIRRDEAGLHIDGVGIQGLRQAQSELDCGNSGTTMRLFSGLLCGQPFVSKLVGDVYLCKRPMKRVAAPLTLMGGTVTGQPGARTGEVYPPLVLGGVPHRLHGTEVDGRVASAQVKSAVLLAALGADGITQYREPSRSRDHTERMLAAMGAPLTVTDGGLTSILEPYGWDRVLHARNFVVPGDLSSAAFLLGAASLVEGSRLRIIGVGINPTRTGLLDALHAMGAQIVVENQRDEGGEPVADLVVQAASLSGTRVAGDLTVRSLDELPLLSALAAHAVGMTVLCDAEELRVKESDRLSATAAMLRAFGVDVEERPDGLAIEGRPGRLRPAVVDSHGDHRIAMAAAVCALAVDGETVIHDADNVATSYPSFAATLADLGATITMS